MPHVQRGCAAGQRAIVDDDAVLVIAFGKLVGESSVAGDMGKRQLAGVDVDESSRVHGELRLHPDPLLGCRKAATPEVAGVGIAAYFSDVEVQTGRPEGRIELRDLGEQNGFAHVSFLLRSAEDVKYEADLGRAGVRR